MPGIRTGLLTEILVMALDTLRANKMRSALTILGVVIGITSIVSMTALIRGFDERFKDLFRQVGRTRCTSRSSA
jgi:putative ABC transport system permease protein